MKNTYLVDCEKYLNLFEDVKDNSEDLWLYESEKMGSSDLFA